jgi:PsbP-like protein
LDAGIEMTIWRKSFFIMLTLTVVLSIQPTLFETFAQSVNGTFENNTDELSQIYENKTANIRIHYPAGWFSESENLEYPQMVRFFPKEFIAEHYPPVVFGIIFLNASNSPISLNLTQMADSFETTAQISPDARFVNSTVNATMFNGTVPAFQINYYDFSRPYMDAQEMITGTFLNNTKTAYALQYYAEPEYFDKYLPQVQKMIDSLQLLGNSTRNTAST